MVYIAWFLAGCVISLIVTTHTLIGTIGKLQNLVNTQREILDRYYENWEFVTRKHQEISEDKRFIETLIHQHADRLNRDLFPNYYNSNADMNMVATVIPEPEFAKQTEMFFGVRVAAETDLNDAGSAAQSGQERAE